MSVSHWSSGSVAKGTRLRCDRYLIMNLLQFTAGSVDEKELKIGRHLAQLWTVYSGTVASFYS